VKDRQEEKAKKDADGFLSALKSGESMIKATKKFGVTPAASGFFKRNDSIPNIGPEREVAQTAFKLSNGKKFPDAAIKGEKGYYVIRLKERKIPDSKGFGKEQAKIKASLLQQKNLRAFEEYLAQIKKRSEISIEEGFLN
jgi:peptidyl-prolyl cis-trans isomerase D